MTKIISGFAGVGKSYLTDDPKFKQYLFKDSDSSEYSWIYELDGTKTDVRHPDFPQNYIEHIKNLIELDIYDAIFISCHENVREALAKNGIKYYLVYPSPYENIKDEYMQRYIDRNSQIRFIQTMYEKFDEMVLSCYNDKNAELHCMISYDMYLSDVIEDILAE
jgi:hypothetical protein